ncbi:MAG: hypothetical protein ING71_16190 [Rhodocyclaceae bacterium]|jgi:hypothetical protein|nr:hypothetical protein [Rhodocyclaceae bacterium]
MGKRKWLAAGLAVTLVSGAGAVALGVKRAEAPQLTERTYSKNFEQIAYHDLEGRAGFKMAMQTVDGRWYLYLAGLWDAGWMILDVTDPKKPVLVTTLPSPDASMAAQVQVSDGLMITSLEPPLVELLHGAPFHTLSWVAWRAISGRPVAKPWKKGPEGVMIWDVKDPITPKLLSSWASGAKGAHRNFYNGGRYAMLAATRPGYLGHVLVILDLQDPAKPKEVAVWSLPEQKIGSGATPRRKGYYLHGPAHVEGNRAYLPYGIGGAIILDISDITKPKEVGRLTLPDDMGTVQGVHSFIPIKSRGLAVINSEAHNERCEPDDLGSTYTAMVDISDETRPKLISTFPLEQPPPDAPYKSFCERSGRAGVHNQHHSNLEPHLFQSDRLTFSASFSAGLRLYDTTDPKAVREIGYFLPRDPRHRLGPLPTTLLTQTEDVIVDARGYAYISDKNQGIYIVRSTSPEFQAELTKQSQNPRKDVQ